MQIAGPTFCSLRPSLPASTNMRAEHPPRRTGCLSVANLTDRSRFAYFSSTACFVLPLSPFPATVLYPATFRTIKAAFPVTTFTPRAVGCVGKLHHIPFRAAAAAGKPLAVSGCYLFPEVMAQTTNWQCRPHGLLWLSTPLSLWGRF
jgi:hypothetical protein